MARRGERFRDGPAMRADRASAVLVTGGSRGIGAAVARAFAAGAIASPSTTAAPRRRPRRSRGLPGEGHAVAGADLADPGAGGDGRRGGGGARRPRRLVNNAWLYERHPIAGTSYVEWQAAWARARRQRPRRRERDVVRGAHMGRPAAVGRQRRLARREPRRARAHRLRRREGGADALGQSLARELGPRGIAVMTGRPASWRPTWPRAPRGAARRDPGAEPARPRGDGRGGRRRGPYLASPEAEMASGAVLDVNGARTCGERDDPRRRRRSVPRWRRAARVASAGASSSSQRAQRGERRRPRLADGQAVGGELAHRRVGLLVGRRVAAEGMPSRSSGHAALETSAQSRPAIVVPGVVDHGGRARRSDAVRHGAVTGSTPTTGAPVPRRTAPRPPRASRRRPGTRSASNAPPARPPRRTASRSRR